MDEDDVKGRILQVAAELFMERGFGGTSVREIGERAGVGQSSLYHHVRSKGPLLQELHQSFAQDPQVDRAYDYYIRYGSSMYPR